MIFFLTGTSSVGKTRLLDFLRRHDVEVISIDEIFSEESARQSERCARGECQMIPGYNHKQIVWDLVLPKLLARLKSSVHSTRPLVVDDIAENIARYRSRLVGLPHQIIWIGTTLPQLQKNLVSRDRRGDSRSAAGVLHETLRLYRPVDSSPLRFTEKQLDQFRTFFKTFRPHSFLSRKVPSAAREFRRVFFATTKDVHVRPRMDHDLFLIYTQQSAQETERTLLHFVANQK